jgi:hypothetical protein
LDETMKNAWKWEQKVHGEKEKKKGKE